jgi:hypothetical protein
MTETIPPSEAITGIQKKVFDERVADRSRLSGNSPGSGLIDRA